MNNAMVTRAIEVFVRGFCFIRSVTHPFIAERIEGLWVMRDAPRNRPRDYRVEEWVAFNSEPGAVDKIVREHARGRFSVCVIRAMEQSPDFLRSEYKRLGYRLLATEPLFVHPLKRISRVVSPVKIEQVVTREIADRFGQQWRHRPMSDAMLRAESGLRQYVAWDDGLTGPVGDAIIGAVRSVAVGSAHWVGDLYVVRAHRRRGIGRALLNQLLRDHRASGSTLSVLLSSHTGAMLYPRIGYEQIGELMAFKR